MITGVEMWRTLVLLCLPWPLLLLFVLYKQLAKRYEIRSLIRQLRLLQLHLRGAL